MNGRKELQIMGHRLEPNRTGLAVAAVIAAIFLTGAAAAPAATSAAAAPAATSAAAGPGTTATPPGNTPWN